MASELATTVSPSPSSDAGGAPLDSLGAPAVFEKRYREGVMLGRGGMGEVRELVDARVGRTVAMKTLHADTGADAAAQVRFVREARIQGQLEHPSVVPVYDFGRDPTGQPYFTMKQLRGKTLAQILAAIATGDREVTAAFSRRKLLNELRNVCLAVDFAHSRGVIHRDLKPGNIMLGDFGEVYVLDWGLAKLKTEATEPAPELEAAVDPGTGTTTSSAPTPRTSSLDIGDTSEQTAAGSLMGTPGYMAPEQVQGRTLTERADVYALGAILFEILAGEPLHHRDRSILEATLAGVDGRPSQRTDREIPLELDDLCVAATRTDPEERLPSARALADRIDRVLDGDRDLARHKQLAEEHTASGIAAAETALAGGVDAEAARQAALRELGKAMIYDPGHEPAVEAVSRLLLEPPKVAPPEVEQTMAESLSKRSREEAQLTAFAYLLPLPFLPLFAWMGIRDPLTIGVMVGTSLLAAGCSFEFSRSRTHNSWMLYATIALTGVFLFASARMFSAFVVVPALASATSVPVTYHGNRRLTVFAGFVLAIAVSLPVVLELAGVLSPTFAFTGDGLRLKSMALDIDNTAAIIGLTAFSIVIATLPMTLTARLTTRTGAYERELALHTWQIKQLMPRAHDLAAAPPKLRNFC